MDNDIYLPAMIVAFAFILKLFINRNADVPKFIESISELPADVMFLAMSFYVAFTIHKNENTNIGLQGTFTTLFFTICVIAMWRYSIALYEKKGKLFVFAWLLLLMINAFIASYAIFKAVTVLTNEKKPHAKTTAFINSELLSDNFSNNNAKFCYHGC